MGCNCGKRGKASESTSAARKRSISSSEDLKCPHCSHPLKKAVGYLRCHSCGYNQRIRR
jgi:DNA-directed RNA polymerase subunit RPC12/RpoP